MPAPNVRYRERLWPSFGVWFLAVFVLAMCDIAVWAALGWPSGLGFTVLSGAGVVYWLITLSLTIEVDDHEVRAGRAHIDLDFISDVEALDKTAARAALGPQADGRTYLVTRAWVNTAVKFAITDDTDPTPSWIVSSRHPDALGRALVMQNKVT
jgi:hypothetical protein